MTKEKTFLIILFLASFILRTYRPTYPPLLWDEASLGYNAYSILKTGRDEYGQILPFIFKSFGDYKPGLYVYLTVPFVAVFGLSEISVRFPSILIGSLTPILLYFLIKRLSPSSARIALMASLLISVNPYNIHFSRGAWETNILTFELILFIFLLHRRKLFLSSLVLASTFYTYQAGKLIPIILLLIYILAYRPSIKTLLVKFFLPLSIFSLPFFFRLIFLPDTNRLNVVSLFSYPRSSQETQTIINESNSPDYYLFHNQSLYFIKQFFVRYFNHFSPRFLVFEGDWQVGRHSAPYIGVLLYPSLIFLIIGLLVTNYRLPIAKFFVLWLLFSPIPAALTRDIVQPVRIMSFSIPLAFFIASGLNFFLTKFSSFTVYCLLITSYFLSFLYYSDLYYNHLVKKSPNDNLYGYRQAMQYVVDHPADTVYFTQFYGQPYIYYLFYSQYPPQKYQPQARLTSSGSDVGQIKQIDNIRFQTPDFNQIRQQPSTLAVFSYDEVLRQNIDIRLLTLPSPINQISTFYAYQN